MNKILVPTVDWPISSDSAYRVAEMANAIGADVVLLFITSDMRMENIRKGNLSLEIFEEAAQDFDLNIDGYIMKGEPSELICQMVDQMAIDLVLVGSTNEDSPCTWISSIEAHACCPVEMLF